jgi:hypothetical protein
MIQFVKICKELLDLVDFEPDPQLPSESEGDDNISLPQDSEESTATKTEDPTKELIKRVDKVINSHKSPDSQESVRIHSLLIVQMIVECYG